MTEREVELELPIHIGAIHLIPKAVEDIRLEVVLSTIALTTATPRGAPA